MAYRIAVATSDGKQVDETFGSASVFAIYEAENGACRLLEQRQVAGTIPEGETNCGTGNGCQGGGGCGGAYGASEKVERLSDCRAIICRKIGFQAQKQLERKAISAFDVGCTVEEALGKIAFYYNRMDRHESLRSRHR